MNKTDIDTSTLAGRILWLVEHCKESSEYDIRYDKDFIRVCGLPNLSYISDLRSGNISSPGFSTVWGIVEALGVNPEWIAGGEEEAFPDDMIRTKAGQTTLRFLKESLQSHQQQLDSLSKRTGQLIELIDDLTKNEE